MNAQITAHGLCFQKTATRTVGWLVALLILFTNIGGIVHAQDLTVGSAGRILSDNAFQAQTMPTYPVTSTREIVTTPVIVEQDSGNNERLANSLTELSSSLKSFRHPPAMRTFMSAQSIKKLDELEKQVKDINIRIAELNAKLDQLVKLITVSVKKK